MWPNRLWLKWFECSNWLLTVKIQLRISNLFNLNRWKKTACCWWCLLCLMPNNKKMKDEPSFCFERVFEIIINFENNKKFHSVPSIYSWNISITDSAQPLIVIRQLIAIYLLNRFAAHAVQKSKYYTFPDSFNNDNRLNRSH